MITRPIHLLAVSILCVAHPAAAVYLPVELASGNTTNFTTVTVTVPVPAGSQPATKLWMKVHNLQRDGQASVKVNSGAWVGLSNGIPELTVNGRGGVYGGIGGGYHTIEMDLALTNGQVVAGTTATIQFRINPPFTNGVSAYRVVNFNFRDAANGNIVVSSVFTNMPPGTLADDSTSFIAANNAANIAAGSNTWHNTNLKEYPQGSNISAKCADCHTQDGRDLRYFGFSNQSIYKRTRFHNVPDAEAKNLTRYIRSLTDVPSTESWGRPWNPPYQPDAGLSGRLVKNWAAGGGLNAVLATDDEMKPHLFPNGSDTQAKVDAVINTTGTIKTFDIPVAMQFPDWNRWVPKIHPKDIWTNFENGAPNAAYLAIRNNLTANGVSYYLANNTRKLELVNFLTELNSAVRDWVGNGATAYDPNGDPTGSPWRAQDSTKLVTAANNGFDRETAKRSMTQWLAVKYFEVMREFNLEDKCPQIMTYDSKAQGEVRGWPTKEQNVHPNAPHITAMNLDNWVGQPELVGHYLSTAWYQLQMVLNAGQGQVADSVQPQDWEYQVNHIEKLSDDTGVQHPLRMVESMLKIYQLRDNQGTVNNGWMMRMCDPHRLYATRKGDTTMMSALEDYEDGLWVRINNAFIKEFVEVVTNPSFEGSNLNNWTRYTPPSQGTEDWWKIEVKTYQPTEWTTGEKFPQNHADSFWRLLPDLKHLGCDATRLANLKNWCASAWPGPTATPNDWDSRLVAMMPTTFQWYHVENVLYSGKRLYGDSLVATNAMLNTSTGPRTQWMLIPVSGPWFRLQRQPYLDGVDYWLRAVGGVVENGNRVEMGTTANTGDQTQWRVIDLGAGQYRIENKNPTYSTAPWLSGRASDFVNRVSTTNTDNSTKWMFVVP
ncbi:MAG: hypothetical protein AB1705_00515 [Verrucomicrobiota bacterium]